MELRDDYKNMPEEIFEAYFAGTDIDYFTGVGVPKMRPDAPQGEVPCRRGCGRMLSYRPGLHEYLGYDPKDFACTACVLGE